MNTGRLWLGKTVDLISYAVIVTAIAFLASSGVSFLFGSGLQGTKFGLFVIGWVLLAYSSIRLRPEPAHKKHTETIRAGESSQSGGLFANRLGEIVPDISPGEDRKRFASTDESPVERAAQELPPARFIRVKEAHRFSTALKLFAASIFILGTSIYMEIGLGVA